MPLRFLARAAAGGAARAYHQVCGEEEQCSDPCLARRKLAEDEYDEGDRADEHTRHLHAKKRAAECVRLPSLAWPHEYSRARKASRLTVMTREYNVVALVVAQDRNGVTACAYERLARPWSRSYRAILLIPVSRRHLRRGGTGDAGGAGGAGRAGRGLGRGSVFSSVCFVRFLQVCVGGRARTFHPRSSCIF